MPNDAGPAPPQTTGVRVSTMIFPSIALPMFLAVVDQTIVATALPSIAASLGNPERVSWVVIAYLIAATISAPLYGNLGDAFGRRRLLLIALGIFFCGSIACSLSMTLDQLTLGRILQGFGSGGLITLSHALLGDAVPARERGRYQGNLVTVVLISTTLGPLAGGVMTQYLGWRSIFLAGIPFALGALLLARLLPKGKVGSGAWRFDGGGLALFAGFSVALLLSLELVKGLRFGLNANALYAFAAAVACLVLLLWWERRARHPLFPLGLLAKPAIWKSYALICAHGASLLTLVTFLPMYCRMELGMSASASGLMLLPLVVGIALGSLVWGRLMSRTGLTAIFAAVGLAIAAALLFAVAALLHVLSPLALSLTLGVAMAFMGSAMGVAMVTLQVAGGANALGITAGIAQLSKSIGSALGTAGGSTIIFLVLAAGSPPSLDYLGPLLADGPAALAGLSDVTRTGVSAVVTNAFRAIFLTIGVFLTCGAISAAVLPIRRV